MMGKSKKPLESSIMKGALAGAVGGLAGAGARALAVKLYSPTGPEGETALLQAEPELPEMPAQSAIKPWIVGAAAGAVYGAAMEVQPSAGVWGGAGFGLGLRRFTNSRFGGGPVATSVRQSTRLRQSEWISYAIFGLVTEAVRKVVRKGL